MKAIVLLWLWIVSLFKREPALDTWAGVDVASDSRDERIMMGCREAHSRGWRFARGTDGFGAQGCGCPMQAIGWLRGVPWDTVAEKEFEIERPAMWGIGFDHAIAGVALNEPDIDADYELGARIARRLKAEGLA